MNLQHPPRICVFMTRKDTEFHKVKSNAVDKIGQSLSLNHRNTLSNFNLKKQ